MNRAKLLIRQQRILEILEAAASRKADQGWVEGDVLAQAAGRRYGAGIWQMDPLKPTVKNPGLGFRIRRVKGKLEWAYRLEGYPADWTDERADLSHIGGRVERPVPVGQQALFGSLEGAR